MSDFNFDYTSGVSDNDAKFQGKTILDFGLNELSVKSIKPNKMAGKKVGGEATEGNAIDFAFEIGGCPRNERLYEPTYGAKVYKGDTQIGTEHEDYNDCFKMQVDERRVWLVHFAKAFGTTEEAITASVKARKPSSFMTWCQAVIKAIPKDYETKTIHCFVEWQSKPGKNKTKTFTQLPKNMKGGKFFVPVVAPEGNGAWEAQIDVKGGLTYVDGAGNVHPTITRSKNFMESSKATQTDKTNGGSRRRGGTGITIKDGDTAHPVLDANGKAAPQSNTGASEDDDNW